MAERSATYLDGKPYLSFNQNFMNMSRKLLLFVVIVTIVSSLIICSCKKANLNSTNTNPTEFDNCTFNGTTYVFTNNPLNDSLGYYDANFDTSLTISGFRQIGDTEIDVDFERAAIAVGSSQPLKYFGYSFNGVGNFLTPVGSFLIHITEYGAIGQHVAGNYSGLVTDGTHNYTASGSFRLIRAAAY